MLVSDRMADCKSWPSKRGGGGLGWGHKGVGRGAMLETPATLHRVLGHSRVRAVLDSPEHTVSVSHDPSPVSVQLLSL